jgi:hypothetical protein
MLKAILTHLLAGGDLMLLLLLLLLLLNHGALGHHGLIVHLSGGCVVGPEGGGVLRDDQPGAPVMVRGVASLLSVGAGAPDENTHDHESGRGSKSRLHAKPSFSARRLTVETSAEVIGAD